VCHQPTFWLPVNLARRPNCNDLNKLTGVNATRLVRAYDIIAKVNADSQSMMKIIGLLKFHRWVLSISSVIDATRVN
jgi:hypothetical protein